MRTSEKVDEILPAVMKVKNKLQAVAKSTNNPFFKSKYADLNTHLEEVEPLLEENGLMLLQPVTISPTTGANIVSSTIINKNGQFISSEMTVVARELDMQKLGSAITYARRYTLGALLSMKTEDDDGNAAVGKEKNPPKTAAETTNAAITKPTSSPSPEINPDRPSFKRPKAATVTAPVAQESAPQDDI